MIWLVFLLQISSTAAGEKIFAANCSVGYCHGAGGAAARGPRLRGRTFDKKYFYSGIRDGIPNSAMPAWKDRLKEDEISATVAYIQGLAGGTSAEAAAPVSNAPATSDKTAAELPGREGFFASGGCANCHALGGQGTAVGPDVCK